MSATIQEFFTDGGVAKQPYIDMFNRLQTLGIGIHQTISDYDSYDDTKHVGYSLATFKIPTVGNGNLFGGYDITSDSGCRGILTYNVDKDLAVITAHDILDTNHSCFVRLPLICTAEDHWSLGRAPQNAIDTVTEADASWTWAMILGQQTTAARPSPDGKVALYSNPLIGVSSSDSFAVYQHRLEGDGIYVAKEDIIDPVSDIGTIISDGTKAYICCGCRIWMDYEGPST